MVWDPTFDWATTSSFSGEARRFSIITEMITQVNLKCVEASITSVPTASEGQTLGVVIEIDDKVLELIPLYYDQIAGDGSNWTLAKIETQIGLPHPARSLGYPFTPTWINWTYQAVELLTTIAYRSLKLFVDTPGLNQWTTIKPLIESGLFAPVSSYDATETQYGVFYTFPFTHRTQVFLEAHKILGGTISNIIMNYRRYRWTGADLHTYNLVVSQTEPTVGSNLLAWNVFGSITPNTLDYTTIVSLDITACTAFVDDTLDFWVGVISKPHYDGVSPSIWPNAAFNGGSTWVNIQGFTIS